MQKSSCESPNTSRSPATQFSLSPVLQYKRQIRERDGEIRKFKAKMTEKQHEIDLLKNEIEELKRKISDLTDEIKRLRKIENEKRTLQTEVSKLTCTIETLQSSVDDKTKEIEKLKKDTKRLQQISFDLESAERDKAFFTKENEDLHKSLEKKEKTIESLSKKLSSVEHSAKEKDDEVQITLEALNATIKKLETDCGHYRDQCDQLQYLALDAERARSAETQLKSKLIQKEEEIEVIKKTLAEEQEKFRNSTSSLKIENDQLMELNFIQKQKFEDALFENKSLQERLNECEKCFESSERDKVNLTKQFEDLHNLLENKEKIIETQSKTLSEIEKTVKEKEGDLEILRDSVKRLETDCSQYQGHCDQLQILAQDAEHARSAETQLKSKLIQKEEEIEVIKKTLAEEQEKFQNATSSLKIENNKLTELNSIQKQQFEDALSKNKLLEEHLNEREKCYESLECEKVNLAKQFEDLHKSLEDKEKTIETLSKNLSETEHIAKEKEDELEVFRVSVKKLETDCGHYRDQLQDLAQEAVCARSAETELKSQLIQKQEEIEVIKKTLAEEQEKFRNATSSLKIGNDQLIELKQQFEVALSNNKSLEERLNECEKCFESSECDKVNLTKQFEDLHKSLEDKEKIIETQSETLSEIEKAAKEKEDELEILRDSVKRLETDCCNYQRQCDQLQNLAQDAERARSVEMELERKLIQKQEEIEVIEKTLSEEQEKLRNSTLLLKVENDHSVELKQQFEEALSKNKSLEERLNEREKCFEYLENEKLNLTKQFEDLHKSLEDKEKTIETLSKNLSESEQNTKKKEVELENLHVAVKKLETDCCNYQQQCDQLQDLAQDAERARSAEMELERKLIQKQEEIVVIEKTLSEEQEKLRNSTLSLKVENDHLIEMKQQFEEALSNNKLLQECLNEREKCLESLENEKISVTKQLQVLHKSLEDKEKKIETLSKNLSETEQNAKEKEVELENLHVAVKKLETDCCNYRQQRDHLQILFQDTERVHSGSRISRMSSETFQSIRSTDANSFFGTRTNMNCDEEPLVMVHDPVTPLPDADVTAKGIETEVMVPKTEPLESFTIFKRPTTPVVTRLRFDSSNDSNDYYFESTMRKERPVSSVSSSTCSTPSDWSRRLTILNDRNQQVPQHLRSFYPVETQQLPMDVHEDEVRNSEHYQPPATVQHLRSRENFKTTSTVRSKGRDSVQRSPFESLRKLMGKSQKLSANVVVDKADLPENAKMKKSALSYNIENSPIAKRGAKKPAKKKSVDQPRNFFLTPRKK